MLNIHLLNDKYKNLIPQNDIDNFIIETHKLKQRLNFNLINELKPLLIYNRNQRNQLYYLLSVNYSLQLDKILNYTVITGQTFTRQHFANDEKDKELYDNTYYDDLVFISLSQSDYTSEYMENLIIDLVEFRARNNKITVITYDLLSSTNYQTQTRKLSEYFAANKYTIMDLSIGQPTTKSTVKQTTKQTLPKNKTGRIL